VSKAVETVDNKHGQKDKEEEDALLGYCTEHLK
jgi:hypothetical protein